MEITRNMIRVLAFIYLSSLFCLTVAQFSSYEDDSDSDYSSSSEEDESSNLRRQPVYTVRSRQSRNINRPQGISRSVNRKSYRHDTHVRDFNRLPSGDNHIFATPVKYLVFGSHHSGRYNTNARVFGGIGKR
ncbi:unnamed protein product [Notodromas monacha]|uniref:Uncharacterized protein n=1 Tax=Notodromas monacha TaxID=399045 RepID=A0A7R9BMP2_9CRUS|nr:unnamed protein product [Notodromas monacha]CAG0918327.1 unnamed protein product [Notodromas monacha]